MSPATQGSATSGTVQTPPNDLLLAIRKEYPDRYFQGTATCTRSCRKGRSSQLTENRCRSPQDVFTDQQGFQTVESVERSSQTPSRAMAQTPQGFNHSMGDPNEGVSGATKTIYRADQQSQSRIIGSTSQPASTQQACRPSDERQCTEHAGCSGTGGGSGRFRGNGSSTYKASTRLPQTGSLYHQPTDVQDIMESDEEDFNGAPKSKRQRSLEPFGHQAPPSAQVTGAMEGTNDGSM